LEEEFISRPPLEVVKEASNFRKECIELRNRSNQLIEQIPKRLYENIPTRTYQNISVRFDDVGQIQQINDNDTEYRLDDPTPYNGFNSIYIYDTIPITSYKLYHNNYILFCYYDNTCFCEKIGVGSINLRDIIKSDFVKEKTASKGPDPEPDLRPDPGQEGGGAAEA